MNTLVDRLRDVGCDRAPFTPEHAECVCRLANEAADELERLDKMVRHASEKYDVTFPSELLPSARASVFVVDPQDGSEQLVYDPDAETSSKH